MSWFEDESLWGSLYPFLFDERRFASAPEEIEAVLALTGVRGGSVLDLCCGPGRHSAVLARRGFAVTGVDRSAFLLAKAREHAAGLPVEFVQADVRHFRRDDAFDIALSLFTSFGYFDVAGDRAVLEAVYNSLRPNGSFVIDVLGKEQVAAQACSTTWLERDGHVFIDHHQVLPGWSQVRIDWLLVTGPQAQRFEMKLNVYSGAELTALLRDSGFRDIRLFGSLAGAAYDSAAKRLVTVATK